MILSKFPNEDNLCFYSLASLIVKKKKKKKKSCRYYTTLYISYQNHNA